MFTAADHHDAKRKFEAEHLARKLRESGGNINPAAAAIVLERQNLQERIRQLGLK